MTPLQPQPQPGRMKPAVDEDDSPSARAKPRFALPDVLKLVPKTKRSQIELLVRTGRIVPAWPSPGTGRDRGFDERNVVEIAIAAELIAIGLVGERLALFFRDIVHVVLDAETQSAAEYLVLFPSNDGPWHVPKLLQGTELPDYVGLGPAAFVLNVRRILAELRLALNEHTAKGTSR